MSPSGSRCPYCNFVLDIAPKRKKACPNCGKSIFVRKGDLVTEDEAQTQDWLVYLDQFSITRADIDRARRQLAGQFGFTPHTHDVVWRILNDIVSTKTDAHSLERAYYEMARLASFEGKDPKPYIAQALKTQLMDLKRHGAKAVAIESYGGEPDWSTCSACKALHGNVLPIEDALAELPVPMQCTNESGCRCHYVSATPLIEAERTAVNR